MNCPSCQKTNPENARFCMACGNKMERNCSACGTSNAPGAKFCMECGTNLKHSTPAPAPLKTSKQQQSAERRQLTVMFCSIVESTELSNQLDAEDFRQHLLDYQQLAKKVITRYGGYIAQYLDNGLLVYFGYPKGIEDAPKTAIRCGLGLNDALRHANTEWIKEQKRPLALQMGIHTGLVVVDLHLALGDTTNIAARIEKLAEPGTILISKPTKKIVDGWFEVESLGKRSLKGIEKPMEVFKVNQASGVRSRFQIAINKGLTPLVGRESEMQMLQSTWQKVYHGQGQLVLLSGEAGIGKSRLVESVKAEIVTQPDAWLVEVFCSAHHQNTVFYPIIQLIETVVLKFDAKDTEESKRSKVEGFLLQSGLVLEATAPLFLEFLSFPPSSKYAASTLSPAGKKKQLMEAILKVLINRAKLQPVLLVIEDLHWADPSTLEWINMFVDQLPTYSILALCTARPKFHANWLERSHAIQIKLQGLSGDRVESICYHQSHGKALPSEVVRQIVEKTDGIPLFVEELTRMVLDSDMLIEKEDTFELNGNLPALAIPSTLQDSLIARLDQLDNIKELTQIGSVLGREFSFGLLKSVSERTFENLEEELAMMAKAELIFQRGLIPDAQFIFKHALVQDTAYNSLLKSQRQKLHLRVSQVLEQEFEASVKVRPELLAHHLTEAKKSEEAIDKWLAAGILAIGRHAFIEGVAHLKKGLALLPGIPDESKRLAKELSLLKILTPSLQLSQGYGNVEVEHMANRWLEVAKIGGNLEQIYDAQVGQFTYYTFSGNYEKGRPASQELVKLGQQRSDRYFEAISLLFDGIQKTLSGAYALSQKQFLKGLKIYNREDHLSRSYYNIGNYKSVLLTYYSTPLYLLGYPNQALSNLKESKAIAHEVNQPASIYSNAAFLSRLYLARREYDKIKEVVEPVLKIAQENGDTFIMGLLSYYLSTSIAHQGNEAAAHKAHHIANQIYKVYKSYRPAFLVYVADAFCKLGKYEIGMDLINESFKHVFETTEKLYLAELHRVKGKLLLLNNEPFEEVKSSFEKAIRVAQEQGDRWHELLAAKDLAEVWQKKGDTQAAFDLLNPIYEAFPEKTNLIDLEEIKNVLANEKTEKQ